MRPPQALSTRRLFGPDSAQVQMATGGVRWRRKRRERRAERGSDWRTRHRRSICGAYLDQCSQPAAGGQVRIFQDAAAAISATALPTALRRARWLAGAFASSRRRRFSLPRTSWKKSTRWCRRYNRSTNSKQPTPKPKSPAPAIPRRVCWRPFRQNPAVRSWSDRSRPLWSSEFKRAACSWSKSTKSNYGLNNTAPSRSCVDRKCGPTSGKRPPKTRTQRCKSRRSSALLLEVMPLRNATSGSLYAHIVGTGSRPHPTCTAAARRG